MNTEIFIENKRLDITEGFSNLISYAIDDIKDFGSRNSAYSKTLVLPGTANNNFLFGHLFKINTSNDYSSSIDNVGVNFNVAKSAECVIFQNHIQVFKGILRLMKVIITNDIPEYEVSVFGELGGLVSAIGNKKLEDLDFSAYNGIFNTTGVTASWDNAQLGYGTVSPLIDYGTVSAAKLDWDIRACRPALFVKEYIDKIITGAGYTYSSNLVNTTRFKSLIIPNNQKKFSSLNTSLSTASITATEVNPTTFPWDAITAGDFSLDVGNTRFKYNGSANVIGRIKPVITGEWDNEAVTISFYKNGTEYLGGTTFPYIPVGGAQAYTYRPEMAVSLSTSDYINCTISYSSQIPGYVHNIFSFNLEFVSDVAILVELAVGNSYLASDFIPRNITQKDFLSSIIKLFNLYLYEDKLSSKFLYLEPYVDFFNATGMVDWTAKIDRSKPIEITPMSELNSRYYEFGFKPDTDFYNELYKGRYSKIYGDYIYDSEFEFNQDKANIGLIFSPSVLVGYSGEDKFTSALFKKNAGVEEKTDTNIRIMQCKKITGVTSWSIKDGATVLQSGLTSYGYAGHYNDPDAPANDIHFGVPDELFFILTTGAINVTQFNIYWSSYMAEVADKDSKLISAYFKLNSRDIYDIDFSKYVYINGVLYRLNKIIDWNASEPDVCKCELLKVNYTTY